MIKILFVLLLVSGMQSTPLPSIEIHAVDKDILTYARVDCSNFIDSFERREMKRKKIKGKRKANELISALQHLEVYENRTKTDTRAIITIRYADHVETICADKFSVYKDGRYYKITDRLKKIIW